MGIAAIAMSALLSLYSFALPQAAYTITNANEIEAAAEQNSQLFASDSLSGNGTQASPYIIDTPADFLEAARLINTSDNSDTYGSAVYSVTSCLDFNGLDFVPWGTAGAPFNGVLNGNGHKLYNIAVSDMAYFGVVGYMENASVNGVHAEYTQSEITVSDMIAFGGIAAFVMPSLSEPNVSISQCSVKGDVGLKASYSINAGGICGYVENKKSAILSLTDCVSYISLAVESNGTINAGGVGGHFSAGSAGNYKLSNSLSYAYIDVSSKSGYVGNFVGYANAEEKGWGDWISFGSLSAENPHFDSCISFGDVATTVNHAGIFAGYSGYGDVVVSNCAYSAAAALKVEDSAMLQSFGSSCSIKNLTDESYMSTNFGFDFENTWTMGEDGVMTLKNECIACGQDPYIILTEGEVTVSGYSGELAISVFKNKVLDKIVFVLVPGYYKASFEELNLDIDSTDTVKIFLFEDKQGLKPLVQSETLVIS